MIVHIDERLSERLIDQEATKTRAVNIQLCLELASLRGLDACDEPALVQRHLLDLIQDPDHAARRRPTAKEVRNHVRVEVPGVRYRAPAVQEFRRKLRVHQWRLSEALVVDRVTAAASQMK